MTQLNRLFLTAAALAVCTATGCEEEDWWSLSDDLVTTSTVAIDGKIYVLSPHGDRVLQIDRQTLGVEPIGVGANPQVITADDGEDGARHIYTINGDDHTMSIVDVAAFGSGEEGTTPPTVQLKPFFDELIFSPSGGLVVSYIGSDISEADLAGLGSVNPNEIAIIDLAADPDDAVEFRTLESRPTNVIFSSDGTKALISTGTGLVALYMDSLETVTYPFTVDPANPVGPSLVRVNLDGTLAFAAAPGSDVVYVIDLVDPNFNLIGTPFVPTDIVNTPDDDVTMVAGGTGQVVVFDHVSFVPDEVDVGTSVDTIVMNDWLESPVAVLYHAGLPHRSFATIQLDDGEPEVETYATGDPITRIDMDPTGQTAVLFHGEVEYGSAALSMFNLDARVPSTILLESAPNDMTFIPAQDQADGDLGYVAVVLTEAGRVVRYSLSTYEAVVIDVGHDPLTLHDVNDGSGFVYVVHDEPLGMMTFLNPYSPLELPGGFPTVYGYGLTGIMD